MNRLDREETEALDAYERGDLESVATPEELARIRDSAQATGVSAVAATLREERDALGARIAQLRADMGGFFEASRDSNADDEHDPEGQTIAFERSQLATVTDQAVAQLAEVEAALDRLDGGTYGVCEVCDEPIPAARLEARPTARTCVDHAPARRR